jgi:hypothetical protein
MAFTHFPIEYFLVALFASTLIYLFIPSTKQTKIESEKAALITEIDMWRYQADTYFDVQDWNGYYGAISKSQDATIKLIEIFESEGA